jgi:hypothetical protein
MAWYLVKHRDNFTFLPSSVRGDFHAEVHNWFSTYQLRQYFLQARFILAPKTNGRGRAGGGNIDTKRQKQKQTKYMDLSPSSEAKRHSLGQETSHLLLNRNVH